MVQRERVKDAENFLHWVQVGDYWSWAVLYDGLCISKSKGCSRKGGAIIVRIYCRASGSRCDRAQVGCLFR